jgi:hypothetical protein
MAHIIDGSGNSNQFRDIHGVVDGKLYRYGIKTRYPVHVKQEIIKALIILVKNRANESIVNYGIHGLSVICNDTGTAANWHGTDGLLADDILVEIADLITQIKDDEVIDTAVNHLCEQMADMIKTNGYCSSGRSGRCFQVYMFLRDYIDNIHNPKSI